MRTLALTILTMGTALAAGHVQAQTYDPAFPVCLHVVSFGATPYYRCSYTTMDQCRASANGQACVVNPYYAAAKAPVKRDNRRYSGQIKSRPPSHAGTRSYAPPRPTHYRAAPYNQFEPYYGASQGYAPGEKEKFIQSMRQNL
ncbi:MULTISPECIES: DUF3551 domain-containing protein [Bradyrhizobium]|uniref:DUF3551 domain-containing protein n=1 Tax=Bradyrhizobium TaxID=374 RepID=UPI001B89DA71|nr:DUF3551 domain-containing protein [Bradyrhizobium sp. Bra78]MBR0968984.1 DUF3551 domain-containing protein [Bradyrhizobium japonicum]